MRASLSAVRAAQAEALTRNRRETLKARLLVGTAVVTFSVGLVVTRTRAARKHGLERAAVAAIVPPSADRPAPTLAAPSPAGAGAAAPTSAARAAAPEAPASATLDALTPDAAADAAVAECELLCGAHRWREAAQPCAAAVKVRPEDARIVLGLAQSAHARNHMAEAGEWAKRAIALDPSMAEAFVIKAHADARAGDRAGAARDFRRYLALAPRGWHAKEARAALRAHRARGDAAAPDNG
jgi:hypothetical protein